MESIFPSNFLRNLALDPRKMIFAEKISFEKATNRGCQMVYFKTKNPNLCIFWRAVEWKMFSPLFTAVWYKLWSFGIFFPFWYGWTNKIWQP
jgi:hypothetical protein